ncbi:MAG: hypothetical protein WCL51_01020 [Bacteroidota bacterium]
MKNLYLLLIVLLLIFGCKSKEKKFDDIEFMAYTVSEYLPGESKPSNTNQVFCRYYALTDNLGKTKLVVQNLNVKNDIKFYDIVIDKKIINDLVDSIMRLKSYTELKCHGDLFYDGLLSTIRINTGYKSKTVTFINYYDKENAIYLHYYRYIDSLIRTKNYIATKDTNLISKRRKDFMNWTYKLDTLTCLIPIYINEPVEFIPPQINKHNHKHPKKD